MRHLQSTAQFKSQTLGEISQRATILGKEENTIPYFTSTSDVLKNFSELYSANYGFDQSDFYFRGIKLNSDNMSINQVPIQSFLLNSSKRLWSVVDIHNFDRTELIYGQNLALNNTTGSANIQFRSRQMDRDDTIYFKFKPIAQWNLSSNYINFGLEFQKNSIHNQFYTSLLTNNEFVTKTIRYAYPNQNQLSFQNLIQKRISSMNIWSHYLQVNLSNSHQKLDFRDTFLTYYAYNQSTSPTIFSYLKWDKISEDSKWYSQIVSSVSFFHTAIHDSFLASNFWDIYNQSKIITSNKLSFQSNGYKNLGSRAVFYYGGQLSLENIHSDYKSNYAINYFFKMPLIHSHLYFKKEIRPSSDLSWILGANMNIDHLNAQLDNRFVFKSESINKTLPSLSIQSSWLRHLCENSNYSIQLTASYLSPSIHQLVPLFVENYFVPNIDLTGEKKVNLEVNLYRKIEDKLEVNFSSNYSLAKDAILARDYYGENTNYVDIFNHYTNMIRYENASLASNFSFNSEIKYHFSNSVLGYSQFHYNYIGVHNSSLKYAINQLPFYGQVGLKFKTKNLFLQAWTQVNLGQSQSSNVTRYQSELNQKNISTNYATIHFSSAIKLYKSIYLKAKVDNIFDVNTFNYLSQVGNSSRQFLIQISGKI